MSTTYFTTVEVRCQCGHLFNVRVKGYKREGEYIPHRGPGVNTRLCNSAHCLLAMRVEVYSNASCKAWIVNPDNSHILTDCTFIGQEKVTETE